MSKYEFYMPEIQNSNPYIVATWWCKPLILKLDYFDITESIAWNIKGCTDIGIIKKGFVAKTLFLSYSLFKKYEYLKSFVN